MLFLVSGTSRAGKTIIAKKIAAQKGISYFSTDWLVMGFTNGIPEYGIHHLLFPDEIAERSWSFLKAMFESMIWSDVDYIIEGEAMLPELIIELLKKHPDKLKICFVGYTDVDLDEKMKNVKDYSDGETDWLHDKPDAYILDHIKNMIAHSKKIKKSCKKHTLKYFDTSKNFTDTIEDAVAYLLA
ncbi:hypothetical protein H2O64_06720 [Kordia sp. YSTF-M3]|uniref:Adenylate kinase n=1 Tax=Kordia aestuariivivens TaxID=2759037 RepID=A0ABR7Q753_9FLAO|nr:hypothetical protein [Kordia aestuariivivens]MBC8754357.1 hypothetical protein [Kordia aestuariivivens]